MQFWGLFDNWRNASPLHEEEIHFEAQRRKQGYLWNYHPDSFCLHLDFYHSSHCALSLYIGNIVHKRYIKAELHKIWILYIQFCSLHLPIMACLQWCAIIHILYVYLLSITCIYLRHDFTNLYVSMPVYSCIPRHICVCRCMCMYVCIHTRGGYRTILGIVPQAPLTYF